MEKTLDVVLQESWNNLVDPREPYYDTPGFGWLARRMGLYSNRADRSEGRYAPIYDNEYDLKAIRMAAWVMDAEVPVAKAMKARLVDYTIASGFDWQIEHESKEIADYLTRAVTIFFNNCDWSELEAESFERELVDGEFIAEIVASSGDFSLEVLEGDNLTEPIATQQLNSYLGVDFEHSWSFGVLTRKHRHTPIAYHVVRDDAGSDWEAVDAESFVHWKRNVPRNAKRGASDHYTTHKWLGYGNKVLGAAAQGTAIQASIAYIVEHALGTTGTQAAALANARSNVVVKRDAITGESYRSRQIKPGQVIEVKNGSKYHASLLGSNASTIYIDVMEALFRLSGTVYAFPEHMLTGYAGNNNRASSETAESPFLQGRMRDQRRRTERMRALIKQISRVVVERMPGRRWDWEDVQAGLTITVNPPEIRSRDIGQLTAALGAQADRGWISDRQAVQELGRDYDDVQEQLSTERDNRMERAKEKAEQQALLDKNKKTPVKEGTERRTGDYSGPILIAELDGQQVALRGVPETLAEVRSYVASNSKYAMLEGILSGATVACTPELLDMLDALAGDLQEDAAILVEHIVEELELAEGAQGLAIREVDAPAGDQLTNTQRDLLQRWADYP